MNDLPPPPVPPDADLSDFAFTPIFRARLFASRFHARATDAEWRAGVTLWLKSWDQVPAGSLPDDDIDLCRLAELGRDLKAWSKIKPGAMHGWFKCSDGLLYHRTVADGINEAWHRKTKQRERGAKGAAGRWGAMAQASLENASSIQKPCLKHPGAMAQASPENASAMPEAMLGDGKGQWTVDSRQGRYPPKPPKGGGATKPASRPPKSMADDPECAAFYRAYPRRTGPDECFRAWQKAIRNGAQAIEIMAGLARFEFSQDPQFVPHPATWLNAGHWKSEPAKRPVAQLSLVSDANPTGRVPTALSGGL